MEGRVATAMKNMTEWCVNYPNCTTAIPKNVPRILAF